MTSIKSSFNKILTFRLKPNYIYVRQMSITHCIFDLDGLLLDTESIYTKCIQKLCAPYGKNFATEIKLKMMGKSSLEAGRILIRNLAISSNERNLVLKFL